MYPQYHALRLPGLKVRTHPPVNAALFSFSVFKLELYSLGLHGDDFFLLL